MKRFSLIAIIMLAANIAAGAQGVEDALRYSEQFYVGSARTIAMGNAFTALGGDLGAVGINPASSALYNCCEFAITGDISWNKTNSLFYGSNDSFSDSVTKTNFSVPNLSMVFALPTGKDWGLVSYSIGFGLTKTNNFNSRIRFGGADANTSLLGNIAAGLEGVDKSELLAEDAFDYGYCTNQEILAYDTYLVDNYNGLDDSYIGATENEWPGGLGVDNLLDKSYDRTTGGGMYDIQFNAGANINDRLYLGANFNVKTVDYEENMWYGENAYKGDVFDSAFKGMSYNYWQRTEGVGVNLQLGAIYVPFNFLRLGISYTTPTSYFLTDRWQEYMQSSFDTNNYGYKSAESESPLKEFEYKIKAPSRLSLGTAIVFGTAGLVSFDWERVNYGKMKMADGTGKYSTFDDVNQYIADYCTKCNIFRVGAEMNLGSNFALRGGYTGYFYENPGNKYISFGCGWRLSENSSLDLAYRTSLKDQYQMTPYDDYAYDEAGKAQCLAPVADITSSYKDLMLTYRVKF